MHWKYFTLVFNWQHIKVAPRNHQFCWFRKLFLIFEYSRNLINCECIIFIQIFFLCVCTIFSIIIMCILEIMAVGLYPVFIVKGFARWKPVYCDGTALSSGRFCRTGARWRPQTRRCKRSVVGASIKPAPDQRSGSLSYPKIRITHTSSMTSWVLSELLVSCLSFLSIMKVSILVLQGGEIWEINSFNYHTPLVQSRRESNKL